MGRRLPGGVSSELISLTNVKDTDPLAMYHDPNGPGDRDVGLPLCIAQSTPVANCETAAATVAKAATLSNLSFNTFTLKNGREVVVFFTNKNTATNPTFNLNNTGAFPLRLLNQASSVNIGSGCWGDGVWLHLKYVETQTNQYWLILGHNIASATSEYTTYADGTIEYNKNYVDSNFRLKTQSSTDLAQYSNGILDLNILNPQDSQRNGYILMIMGNTSNGDYTYTKIYHIRIGYNGNYHQESIISDLHNSNSNVTPVFSVVDNKLRLTVYLGTSPIAFRYKLL